MGILIFVIFLAIVPFILILSRIFGRMEYAKRLVVLLHLLVWSYEVFFLAAICGLFPHAQVHFGGGLGDLLFFFIAIALVVLHIIVLCIMVYKVKKTAWFLIPLIFVFLPLVTLHETAARGNRYNDYMTGGNFTGLYYDRESIYKRNLRRQELENVAKPKKPEFATPFESALYDAEHGDLWAQNHIGVCYMQGDGVEKNDTLAVKWFLKGAKSGEVCAQSNLGNCYYEGLGGLKVDYAEAVKWYRKAAERGLDNAQYRLGRCYGKGLGVEQSDEEAFKWLCMAARQGHEEAQKLLRDNN